MSQNDIASLGTYSVDYTNGVIQFVYRDKVYNESTPVGDQAEIISSKLRNGEPGTDYLAFDGAHNRFLEATSTVSYRARRDGGSHDDGYQY